MAGHVFKSLRVNGFDQFQWFECEICKLRYFQNGGVYFYFNDLYVKHSNLLSCDEYMIKNLLE